MTNPTTSRIYVDDLKPFATFIVGGIALHLVSGVILAYTLLNPQPVLSFTSGGGLEYSVAGLAFGGILGVAGTVLFLLGLFRALRGLHSHLEIARAKAGVTD